MIWGARGARAGLMAAAALLAIGVSPALAKKSSGPGPVKTATATATTTVNGQPVFLTATCPAKTKVVGGGYIAPSSAEGGTVSDFNLITASRRSGNKAWAVSGYRIEAGATDGPTLSVTAEAYCRSGAGKSKEVSVVQARDGVGVQLYSPTAACPPGRAVVAGGFAFEVSDFLGLHYFHNVSKPFGGVGWSTSAAGTSPSSKSATAIAYCRKLDKAPAQRSAVGAMPPANGTVSAIDTAPCPGKRTALSGGYSAPDIFAGLGIPQIVESRRSEKSWRIGLVNLSGPANSAYLALGLCG